ncbi:MAG: hypothetical protein ACI845_002016 [Gammaproteobacteria bacterium]|jgi:hypothetical protein
MKTKILRGLIVCSIFASSSVFAYSCPMDMRAIDNAIGNSTLSQTDLEKVKALRTKGEKLHRRNDHGGSVNALAEAKNLLGI